MCSPCRGRPKKKFFFACNYFLNFTVKNFTAILYTILNPTSGIKDLKNTLTHLLNKVLVGLRWKRVILIVDNLSLWK